MRFDLRYTAKSSRGGSRRFRSGRSEIEPLRLLFYLHGLKRRPVKLLFAHVFLVFLTGKASPHSNPRNKCCSCLWVNKCISVAKA